MGNANGNRNLMVILSSILLFCLFNCTKTDREFAPELLKGLTLKAEYTSGRGSFDGVSGQSFEIVFKDDRNFYSTGDNGVIMFTGSYEYTRVKSDKARAFLMATSGPKSGTELKVDFYFSDHNEGTFEGIVAQGPKGSQTGHFELKQSLSE